MHSFKYSTTSLKLDAPITSNPSTIAASFAFSTGKMTLFIPNFFASMHIGSIPFVFSI